MNQNNPYAAATTAAFAESGERAAFLKKVYSLLFLGVLGFATTLWAAANVPVVHDLMASYTHLRDAAGTSWAARFVEFVRREARHGATAHAIRPVRSQTGTDNRADEPGRERNDREG